MAARLICSVGNSSLSPCRHFEQEHTMLAIRLPEEIEVRLANLAKRTGRSKTFYAREAILQQME
jgi:hypothetical protein